MLWVPLLIRQQQPGSLVPGKGSPVNMETAATSYVLAILVVLAALACTSTEGAIGICYGDSASNVPTAGTVVKLLQGNRIGRVRLYYANHNMLNALRGTGIEVTVGVTNDELQKVATDTAAAAGWVQDNVKNFINNVQIKYVAVGNEVFTGRSDLVPYLVSAMKNIQNAMNAAGLGGSVKVSTPHAFNVLANSFPPSQGRFSDNIKATMRSLLDEVSANGGPAMVHLYPYFSYKDNKASIKLEYALFKPTPTVHDDKSGLDYHNLFDAQYDAFVAAMADVGHGNLPVVVTESGWPWNGGDSANVANAQTYVNNLIRHVESNGGTPARPGRSIPTYVFSLYNEDKKQPGPGPDGQIERYFGLFNTNGSPSYPVDFSPRINMLDFGHLHSPI